MVALTVNLLIVVGSVAALLWFHSEFTRISDSPPQAADPGEVKLYFTAPGVPAVLTVDVFDDGNQIDLTISADREYQPDSVEFRLVFTGSPARPPASWDRDDKDEHGCWHNLYAVPDDDVKCTTVVAPADGPTVAPRGTEQLVVTGKLVRNETSAMFAQVTVYADDEFSTSAGKRTNFSLPRAGTSYRPATSRSLPLTLGIGAPVYVPSTLDVAVDYRQLRPHEKVDLVAPETLEAGSLSWLDTDASLVRPYGSIIDIKAEEAGQRDLYLIGVAVGLLGAVVPLAANAAWKLSRRPRSD
ncbi:hypothetical protein AB0I60_20405 [Actinosynnema sp. NPDC050436]|uniref:hypothetical protein n=1 Tax=Actinosynnema sp. NPDC050436 TaxID=3155659 RepID=UPI0033D6FEA8